MIVCFQSLTQVFGQKSSAKMTNTGLTMGGNHIPGLAFAEALRLAGWAGFALALLAVSGCTHRQTIAQLPEWETAPPAHSAYPPPIRSNPAPTPTYSTPSAANPPSPRTHSPMHIPPTPAPPGGVSAVDLDYVATHRPILTEEGLATWYTAPYKGRKAAAA